MWWFEGGMKISVVRVGGGGLRGWEGSGGVRLDCYVATITLTTSTTTTTTLLTIVPTQQYQLN